MVDAAEGNMSSRGVVADPSIMNVKAGEIRIWFKTLNGKERSE
jgi:hypothetical protein